MSGSNPLVTICIPTYNGAPMVETAIRSALDQTYPSTQVVAVDDCSTDDTIAILERFQREMPARFQFVVNPRNIGPQANFARCMELAKGTYFKIICQDDRAHPTLVEKQVAVLDSLPNVVAVTARRARLSDSRLFRLYDPVLKMRAGLWRGAEAVRYVFRVSNMIGGPVQLLTRLEALRSIGRVRNDPVVGNAFDIEPLLRLLASGWDLYVMDEILCDYNSHGSSYTTRTITEPAVQEYYFAFREEQARDPLYADCLRLPDDLQVSKRNAVLLLMIAGFASTFPLRDRREAARLLGFLQERYRAAWMPLLATLFKLALYLPGGRPKTTLRPTPHAKAGDLPKEERSSTDPSVRAP